MSLKGKKIGVAFTGSFCTYRNVFTELQKLSNEGAEIQSIFSDSSQQISSRFGSPEEFIEKARTVTGIEPILLLKIGRAHV